MTDLLHGSLCGFCVVLGMLHMAGHPVDAFDLAVLIFLAAGSLGSKLYDYLS